MSRRKRDVVPKGPTPAEIRTHFYEIGDLFGLLWLICDSDSLEIDIRLEFRRLHELLRRQSQVSPLRLSKQILSSGASALMYAIVRLQFEIGQATLKQDRGAWRQGSESLPPEVHKVLLPQLSTLLRDLADLAAIQAGTDRLRELARGKRLANEKVKLRQKRQRLAAGKSPRLTISDASINGDGVRPAPHLNGVLVH